MRTILQKPIISEKTMRLAATGWYTFMADKKARKEDIKKAVRTLFEVDVLEVRTANFKDETKMQRNKKGSYTLVGFKKAVVLLKKGQKIALFETETAKEEPKEEKEVKEKKSLLKGTKVKVERMDKKDKKEEKKG